MTPVLRSGHSGDIPLLWAEPTNSGRHPLVLWLHAFSWSKEDVAPQLIDLALRGFVAMSWDVVQHGERSVETRDALKARVRSDLRRHFWPILAQAADEVPGIIDWAMAHLDIAPGVGIGGISMGGDIAIAAAALDHRINRVTVTLATPDWLRPGSSEAQGSADPAGHDAYRRLDPLTHVKAYAHCPHMMFVCGEHDQQVPALGAMAFVDALGEIYADCPERLKIVLEPHASHQFTPAMWAAAAEWFSGDLPHSTDSRS